MDSVGGWVFHLYKFPGPGGDVIRSLYWVSSVSVQVYCEPLARVPVTTTPAPAQLFEYLTGAPTPRGKPLQRTSGIPMELRDGSCLLVFAFLFCFLLSALGPLSAFCFLRWLLGLLLGILKTKRA